MSHKAGSEFFASKRDWSKRKDLVLGYYLTPYLPKIATQQRPVIVIDGFAGPGKFDDGNLGSPLIICNAIRDIRNRSQTGSFRAILVEKDPDLAARLREAIGPFRDFAEVRGDSFERVLPDIEKLAQSSNLFLYLDPFTVSGLTWTALDRVFSQISRNRSIEVLLNFNVHALARAGCVALGKSFSTGARQSDELVGETTSTKQTIDDVLGGSWWQPAFGTARSFPQACEGIVQGYLEKLRARFAQVCSHEIKDRHEHAVAKYVLVFGSRHPDALELMNDAMAKSLEYQAIKETPEVELLFETRPESLVPDQDQLAPTILSACSSWVRRGDVIHHAIRRHFGRYLRSEIRGQVERLLRSGSLVSRSGKSRVNDNEEIQVAR